MPSAEPTVLAGVDRAAFVGAFGQRLRAAGVPVTAPALAACARALDAAPPDAVTDLYWLGRITLVNRAEDLDTYDEVFAAAFGGRASDRAPDRQPAAAAGRSRPDEERATAAARAGSAAASGTLPWHTLPTVGAEDAGTPRGRLMPELLASAVERFADTPFDRLDEDELLLLGRWLEWHLRVWPTRRSHRQRVRVGGAGVALRETLDRSRRTAWEPVVLAGYEPVRRPRPVTMLADVSQSMQSYALAYLHLMRALARSGRAETFAFSTSVTRLTPALRRRSAAEAMARASEQVVDRYGGTHLAGSLRTVLGSPHGNRLRGGILVIASDGWDSDPPEALAAAMRRARLRAHRVVWLNPRAAAPGFAPLVGSMAAALPFCDAFLAANTLRSLPEALAAITDRGPAPTGGSTVSRAPKGGTGPPAPGSRAPSPG